MGVVVRSDWTETSHVARPVRHHLHRAAVWIQSELCLGRVSSILMGPAQWESWSGQNLHI